MSPCLLLTISICFYSQVKCSIFVLLLQPLSPCGLLHYVCVWFFQYSLLCRATALSSFKFTGSNADALQARLEKMIIMTVRKFLQIRFALSVSCQMLISDNIFCIAFLVSVFLTLQNALAIDLNNHRSDYCPFVTARNGTHSYCYIKAWISHYEC